MLRTAAALTWLLLSLVFVSPHASGDENPLADFEQLNNGRDWPWWRGPSRNGWATPQDALPVKFGSTENVRWKSPVPGRGHSSPIVVADRIFLTTADVQAETQSVLAYQLSSGRKLWEQEINRGGFPQQNHRKNTEASPTIASDGARLFATFFHHQQVELVALDLSGQTLWRKSVGAFNPKKYEYGYAPSPLIYQDSVIISLEYDGQSSIVALARTDGSELWRVTRTSNISFSSPVVAQVAGRDQLLISGSNKVSAYDPANGKPLWDVEGTTAATCGTMIWEGDLVFASGGYPRAETLAVVADGSGRVAWRNDQKCYEQSMIVVAGYVYALTDKGVMYCWRAADGNEMWRERLAGPVSASPIFAGGHIYWSNEAGTMYVFRPNPQRFELIAENRVGNDVFASPAVVNNLLLLRVAETSDLGRQEFLVCIGE